MTMATGRRYNRFVILIAGMGGLLYGIDVGIIAAALLFLGKTVNLSVQQTSLIVAAVLGGSMFSSVVAGVLADRFGRKKMMVASGVLFVASVVLIVISTSFVPLFVGRLLQGASGGVIAVVVPLYLAETLDSSSRGKGTATFQFMLTFGIVVASLTGWFYTHQATLAIAAAAGNSALILAAENHAWRGMFLSVVYPGLAFTLGSCFLSESPRWLMLKGRAQEAINALKRSGIESESDIRLLEAHSQKAANQVNQAEGASHTLFQRKYLIPFCLACLILTFNQTTGINSILAFLVVILRQGGMTDVHATQGDVAVKVLNCLVTIIAVALVDKKGRKFLLKLGTSIIVVSLVALAIIFHVFESKRLDVAQQIRMLQRGNHVSLSVNNESFGLASDNHPMSLTVLYTQGHGDRLVTVRTDDTNPTLTIDPEQADSTSPLVIKRALYGPVPSEATGWLITIMLGVFISAFAVGPGVVVWLALSELLPTRIRSTGMGIALLLNQGTSTLIAAMFLPTVGNYGYSTMFVFWAGATFLYFVVAWLFLPETKGKTLEEIEESFTPAAKRLPASQSS
jgi:MFS transporter, SP family, solute carrier family 2 (myo-inositol transporter), member 13